MRARAPLWLSAPGRYAGIRPAGARLVLAGLAALLLLCLSALVAAGPPPVSKNPAAAASDRADVLLYAQIVSRVRGGENYYAVAAAAHRANGYPLRPFFTMRLPSLAVAEAALPAPITLALLYALAAAVLAAWYSRLAPVFRRRTPALIAALLVGCGSLAFVRAEFVPFHESWSALLIALSLAVWRQDRWLTSIALATCAMLIRETAALYAIVMAICALAAGRRREAAGWGAALAVLALAVAAHAWGWSQVVRTDDASGAGWHALLGFGFFAKAITLLTALAQFPAAIGVLLVGLALFGWTGWPDPLATRVLAVLGGYALLISLFSRTDTYYWAMLVAPISLVGLIFVPDALRDLGAGLIGARRITVTRGVR